MKIPAFSTRIWLAICAFLITLVVILGVMVAKGPRGKRGPSPKLKLGKISRLDLTNEKKKEVRQLFREHRRSHRQVAKQLRRMERQLQRALVNPETTNDELQEAFAAIGAQQRALEQSRFAFTLELRQLIGPANMRPLYRHMDDDDDHRGPNRGGKRRGRDHRDN